MDTQHKTISGFDTKSNSGFTIRLQGLRTHYLRILQTDKPVITIPVIFRRPYDENFISDYLVHILHPINSGLGCSPLQVLLTFAGINISISSNDVVGIQIYREYPLSEESRIDILILLKRSKLLIAIENKIFAPEGFKQTLRYTEAIRESFPDYTPILLFLTPSGTRPKSSDFKPLSYNELLFLFRTIELSQVSERDRVIFQDLLLHMENFIMKSRNLELSEKSVLYVQNFEMINDIQTTFLKDTSNIFQTISEIIKSIVEATGDEWEFDFSENRGWQYWYKKHWLKNQLFIHYEFWFSKESLFTESEVYFMVDVEKKQKDVFLERFYKIQSGLKNKYQKSTIQYRPSSRRLAIAFKPYNFRIEPGKIDRPQLTTFFQKAIDEFLFLVEPIEQTLKNNKFK